MAKGRQPAPQRAKPEHRSKNDGRTTRASDSFPIVGVGASAGGLEALARLLKQIPANSGMAFVMVQHLDPKHESRLTEILSHTTTMPVAEVRDKTAVKANHVYIIPPNTNIYLRDGLLRIEPREGPKVHHLPVDFLFRSLARVRRNRAIGVILSGTASDGVAGMRAIKEAGGITFAQDAESAKYFGMPQSSIAAGVVDFVLSPEEIAKHLAKIGRHPYLRTLSLHEDKRLEVSAGHPEPLNELFRLLKRSYGVDFGAYKASTVDRRIRRRMALHGLGDLKEYVSLVRGKPEELRGLYQDMFIGITSFFREPKTFEVLKKVVFPKILKSRSGDSPIRIWVPGCSTGEEVYSIAIALLEYLRRKADIISIQIFGTDINEEAVNKARQGKYPAEIAADVGKDRLRHFFSRTNDGYEISKFVRDCCIFAKHDIANHPPFSRLDLLSCRNVLIYLGASLQQKLIPLFHYTLKPSGYLMLGTAETIGGFADLFKLVDRKYKIYAKKQVSGRPPLDFTMNQLVEPGATELATEPSQRLPATRADVELQKDAADRIVLNHFAPPSVLVNENMDILHFRGHTGPFLEPAPGAASLNLMKMTREGLIVGLKASFESARKKNMQTRAEGLRVDSNSREKIVNLQVVPIKAPGYKERTFLVLFEDVTERLASGTKAGTPRKPPGREAERRVAQLRQELSATKAYLQSVIENQEASNEELRSLNEEILSTNEELQSTTEELETSNEELQSANEELTTLNEELQNRNIELKLAEERFRAFVEAAPDAMIIVDAEGKIQLINGRVETMLGYSREELLGKSHEILVPPAVRERHTEHRLNYMKKPKARSMGTGLELFAVCKDGRQLPVEISLSPIQTGDGVLVSASIRDITERLHLEQQSRRAAVLEERNRIARDVHDNLSQGLTGIVLQMEGAEEILPPNSERVREHIVQARDLARASLEEARRSLLALRPKALDEGDLPSAIQQAVNEIRLKTPARVEMAIFGTPRLLSERIQENLLRIAQEAINNAVQHAKATDVRVELSYEPEAVSLSVEDNGQGFMTRKARGRRGFGLSIMNERAAEIGSQFNLQSEPGKGTRVEVLARTPRGGIP
jgi:two-component system CheB/CheR fusion protein